MIVNYFSNLPLALRSGGFSAMNAAAAEALAGAFELHYVGPIDPPFVRNEKWLSKAMRTIGVPGRFAFFSRKRLDRIAEAVRSLGTPEASLDFFHGFTPWIHTTPPRPYMAWSDCSFRDYVDIYHDRSRFDPVDLARIEAAEARWLRGARGVLFKCEWAAARAIRDYGLAPDRVASVGNFGEVEMPERDAYAGGHAFVFVSTNFAAKGGEVVLAAIREIRKDFPSATLTIVGDAPPGADIEGVSVEGYLRKEVPAESKRFAEILSRAFALVHPTLSDVAPLILVEAAYFGCPAISSRRYAIPELVEDGQTGILLDETRDPAAVAQAMRALLVDHARYDAMRRAAWSDSRNRHTRGQFDLRMRQSVERALARGEVV